MVYPNYSNKNFEEKITEKKEFAKFTGSKESFRCLEPHQTLIANIINPKTLYTSMLLYYKTGVGKTMTALNVAKQFVNVSSEKVLIIAKNDTMLLNFKNELQSDKCRIFGTAKEMTKNSIKVFIQRHFEFTTIGVLSKTKGRFNNRLVIIDEAHNMLNGDPYSKIIKILQSSTNYRLLLLTATPFIDTPLDIFPLVNILNGEVVFKCDKIPKKYKENITSGNIFFKREIDTLTEKAKQDILKYIKGKVSYLTTDKTTFPSVTTIGTPLVYQNFVGKFKIFHCAMSDHQEQQYNKVFTSDTQSNPLFRDSSYCAMIVYPDNTYGPKGEKKHRYSSNPILLKKNIFKYSTKLFNLLENLTISSGPVLIFSSLVNYSGTYLIREVLKANGYTKFSLSKPNKSGNNYVLIDENINPQKRFKYLNILNSPENYKGDLIKIIIGSKTISEGLTMKGISQIHIMEPHWNLSSLDQVIGRAVRLKSHHHLHPKDRNVSIYYYASVSSLDNSVDIFKYQLSEVKDYCIKDTEYFLRENAIDCVNFKSRNEVNAGDKDFSRDCLYKRCKYICNGKFTGSQTKVKYDKETYNIETHDPELYNFIKNKMESYFYRNSIFFLKNLKEYIKSLSDRIQSDDIYKVLNDFINYNLTIVDKHGRKCVVVYRSGAYIVLPINVIGKYSYYKIMES